MKPNERKSVTKSPKALSDYVNIPTMITALLLSSITGTFSTYVQVQVLTSKIISFETTYKNTQKQAYTTAQAESDFRLRDQAIQTQSNLIAGLQMQLNDVRARSETNAMSLAEQK